MTKDIEREAFEKALAGNNIHNLKVCTIFDDEKNEYFASDVCDPSEDHIVESINLSWRMWQAAKAQVVQSKQDLLDRVNARWQLAHEQCAENWNTYSSAQMDAFDWVEQDIKELLGEAQEQAND